MVKRHTHSGASILCACAGAGGAFYAIPIRGIPIAGLVLVGMISWARAMDTLRAEERSFKLLKIRLRALTVGILLGLGAKMSIPVSQPGLPWENITGMRGILAEDPRTLIDGRGMGRLELMEVQGAIPGSSGEVKASARGRAALFFPKEAMPRLKAFGRKSEVYIQGTPAALGESGEPLFRAEGAHIQKPAPALEQLRSSIRSALIQLLAPKDWGGLGLALLFGVRDYLDRDLADAYRRAGCSHVLALSGMHLGIISGCLALLLKPLFGVRIASVIGGVFIILYVFLVGPQPSLLRSAIMYLLGTSIIVGNFPRNSLAVLSLAFLIQLILTPEAGTSVSFILSYGALAGIMLFQGPLETIFRGRAPACILRPLSASAGAFLATAAISAALFGKIQPAGIILGLILIPLTTVFMIALILILPFASGPLGTILSILYTVQVRLVALGGLFPEIPIPHPPLMILISLALWFLVLWGGKIYGARRRKLVPLGTG